MLQDGLTKKARRNHSTQIKTKIKNNSINRETVNKAYATENSNSLEYQTSEYFHKISKKLWI